MKQVYPILILMILILYSCQSDSDKNITADQTDSLAKPIPDAGHYWWESDMNEGPNNQMKQREPIPADSLHTGYIISRLNALYPEIRLELISQQSDTLLLKISDSRYLTQSMGSSGAQAYLSEVTYNLTEIPGLNFVTVLFRAGDHASPDTYSRENFKRKE